MFFAFFRVLTYVHIAADMDTDVEVDAPGLSPGARLDAGVRGVAARPCGHGWPVDACRKCTLGASVLANIMLEPPSSEYSSRRIYLRYASE